MADDIPFHPLANIFPLLEGVQFRDLVEDIRINRLREPIIILNGAILDGRNRARACVAAQVGAQYKVYEGRDPLAFVISMNLHRRHLDVSQRALIAAQISERAKQRRIGPSVKLGGTKAIYPRPERYKTPTPREKPTMGDAAKLMNVASASVVHAKKVIERGTPSLIKAVAGGEISVSAAATVASFDPAQQTNILRAGPKAVAILRREEVAARRRSPDKYKRDVVKVSVLNSFRIGDGRAIGNVKFDELGALSDSLCVCSKVLLRIRSHVANGSRSNVSDLITERKLAEFIDEAWAELQSAARNSA